MKIQSNKITMSKTEWIHIGKQAGWDNIDSTTDSSSFQGSSYQQPGKTPPEAYRNETTDSASKNFSYIENIIKDSFPTKLENSPRMTIEFGKKILKNISGEVEFMFKLIRSALDEEIISFSSDSDKEIFIEKLLQVIVNRKLVLAPEILKDTIYTEMKRYIAKNKVLLFSTLDSASEDSIFSEDSTLD